MRIASPCSLAALALVCSSACSTPQGADGTDCNHYGQFCSNDKPPADVDISKCLSHAGAADCGAKYSAWVRCAKDHPTCSAAGNDQDSLFSTQCASQKATYEVCLGDAGVVDGG